MNRAIFKLLIISVIIFSFSSCELLAGLLNPDIPGGSAGFTFTPSVAYSGVEKGDIAVADFDGDNDLDFVVTGSAGGTEIITKLYMNNGSGSFTEKTSTGLTAMRYGTVDAADFNNDGDVDLLITGYVSSGVVRSYVFINSGSGTFSEKVNTITGVYDSSSTVGDFDSDGDIDFAISGKTAIVDTNSAGIYLNDGHAVFTEHNPGQIAACDRGDLDCGDLDGDGDLDLVQIGTNTAAGRTARIYQNNGSAIFSEINTGSIEALVDGDIEIGNIDADTDLDLIVSGGMEGGNRITRIYQNSGTASFIEINAGTLVDVFTGDLALGDLDKDGDQDLILTGNNLGDGKTLKLYLNNGSGKFVEDESQTGFTAVYLSCQKIADFNGDADLDFIVTGLDDGYNRDTYVYLRD